MDRLFRNNRARSLTLNAPLVLIFLSAWVSDRWPMVTLPAIATAVAGVVVEAVWLYRSAKNAKLEARGVPQSVELTIPPYEHDENVESKTGGIVSNVSVATFGVDDHAYRHFLIASSQNAAKHVAMMASSHPAVATFERDLMAAWSRRANDNRLTPLDLAKWQLSTQGDRAFRVDAGAFEIHHFHGHTNIRVIDVDRVTVEAKPRDHRSRRVAFAPVLCSPLYN